MIRFGFHKKERNVAIIDLTQEEEDIKSTGIIQTQKTPGERASAQVELVDLEAETEHSVRVPSSSPISNQPDVQYLRIVKSDNISRVFRPKQTALSHKVPRGGIVDSGRGVMSVDNDHSEVECLGTTKHKRMSRALRRGQAVPPYQADVVDLVDARNDDMKYERTTKHKRRSRALRRERILRLYLANVDLGDPENKFPTAINEHNDLRSIKFDNYTRHLQRAQSVTPPVVKLVTKNPMNTSDNKEEDMDIQIGNINVDVSAKEKENITALCEPVPMTHEPKNISKFSTSLMEEDTDSCPDEPCSDHDISQIPLDSIAEQTSVDIPRNTNCEAVDEDSPGISVVCEPFNMHAKTGGPMDCRKLPRERKMSHKRPHSPEIARDANNKFLRCSTENREPTLQNLREELMKLFGGSPRKRRLSSSTDDAIPSKIARPEKRLE